MSLEEPQDKDPLDASGEDSRLSQYLFHYVVHAFISGLWFGLTNKLEFRRPNLDRLGTSTEELADVVMFGC